MFHKKIMILGFFFRIDYFKFYLISSIIVWNNDRATICKLNVFLKSPEGSSKKISRFVKVASKINLFELYTSVSKNAYTIWLRSRIRPFSPLTKFLKVSEARIAYGNGARFSQLCIHSIICGLEI